MRSLASPLLATTLSLTLALGALAAPPPSSAAPSPVASSSASSDAPAPPEGAASAASAAAAAAPAPSTPPPPAAAAPSATATPTASAPPTRSASPETARIHVGLKRAGARLERRSLIDLEEGWVVACSVPCDRDVFVADSELRVTAPGMTPSNPFRVEPGSGTARLRVSPGSAELRHWGIVSLAVGAPVALGGFGLYGGGRMAHEPTLELGGLIVLGLGAAAILTALPLLGMGGTSVYDGKGGSIARARRTPIWPTF